MVRQDPEKYCAFPHCPLQYHLVVARRRSNVGGEKRLVVSPGSSSSSGLIKKFRQGEEVMALWKKTKYPAKIRYLPWYTYMKPCSRSQII